MKLNRLSVSQQKIYVSLVTRRKRRKRKTVSRSENVATSRKLLHLNENFFDFLLVWIFPAMMSDVIHETFDWNFADDFLSFTSDAWTVGKLSIQ